MSICVNILKCLKMYLKFQTFLAKKFPRLSFTRISFNNHPRAISWIWPSPYMYHLCVLCNLYIYVKIHFSTKILFLPARNQDYQMAYIDQPRRQPISFCFIVFWCALSALQHAPLPETSSQTSSLKVPFFPSFFFSCQSIRTKKLLKDSYYKIKSLSIWLQIDLRSSDFGILKNLHSQG